MRRLNSVVVKLWLSIILIVTTVLLLLSGFLITFIQSYNTSNIGENLYNNAAKIERLMLNTHEKDSTIDYARELVEDPAGLIIIKNKKDLQEKSEDPLKGVMINEIRKNPSFNKVFRSNEHVLKEIKLTVNGEDHRYILLGYPSQAFQSDNAGIFIPRHQFNKRNAKSDYVKYIDSCYHIIDCQHSICILSFNSNY